MKLSNGIKTWLVLLGVLLSSAGCFKKKVDLNERALNLVIGADVSMDPIYANDAYSSGEIARFMKDF